jgi:hypothetical protein
MAELELEKEEREAAQRVAAVAAQRALRSSVVFRKLKQRETARVAALPTH